MIKSFLTFAVLVSMFTAAMPAAGQDLVPVSDITGGSSVFVFRGSSKAAPKRFVVRSRSKRTKSQRIETARKVNRQYKTLAKAAPRRARSTVVVPEDPRLPKIPTMAKEEASVIFAGVGEYYMDRDEFDRAIQLFRESSTMDSKNAKAISGLSEALALKGNELLLKDDAGNARKFFEEALKHNPKNSPAYFGLAEVYSDLNEDALAIKNYELALEHDKDLTEIFTPLGILYYQQGEIAKAEIMLQKAIANGMNDAQTLYFMGLVRHSQNRNDEALASFEKAKAIEPTNHEAFYYSAETLVRLDRRKDAIADYTRATELKADYFEAWFGLGSVQYDEGNYPAAIEAFKRAARLRNNSVETYINLADAHRQAGNYNDAEANYQLASSFFERDPNFDKEEAADIYSKIGFVIAKQCEINLKKGVPCRWDVAVKALEKGSSITNNNVDVANLGWAYYSAARVDIAAKREAAARAKLEKAKVYLEKAAYSSPKYIEGPLLNLGMTLTDLGDYAGAVDALKRVVAKQPKWTFALNELGIAYRKQNNFKEAAAQFREAIKRDGKYAIAHYNLGETEFRSGNLGEAKKAYQNLKKLGRNDLAAQLELISMGAVRS